MTLKWRTCFSLPWIIFRSSRRKVSPFSFCGANINNLIQKGINTVNFVSVIRTGWINWISASDRSIGPEEKLFVDHAGQEEERLSKPLTRLIY